MRRELSLAPACIVLALGAIAFLAGRVPVRPQEPSRLAYLPAFPGAEGSGAVTPGGRGGDVYEVTNLNDAGPGSLREAIEADGRRIVVFRVSGTILLETRLRVSNPYITIAGQTAPGDGICLRGKELSIDTHDVILRYLRCRRGFQQERNDSVTGKPTRNIIVDHVSASWGLDENISLYKYEAEDGTARGVENLTIQWSISSEALNVHNHAFGATWGGKNASFHHNLFANNTGRNPSIGWGEGFDFRNNVLFNWRHRTIDGGDGTSRVNVVANYLKPGPATREGALEHRICKPEVRPEEYDHPGVGKWYVADNFVFGNAKVTADNWDGGVQFEEEALPLFDVADVRATEPLPAHPITQQTAEEAYELVLATAGASLPRRDAVDRRIIDEVRTGKPTFGNGIILLESEVGGWPELRSTPAPADGDHDGMPDEWERKFGLAPERVDGSRDADGDGYTNVEEWANGTDPTEHIDYRDPRNNVNTLHDLT